MENTVNFTQFLTVAVVSTILGISRPSVLALVRRGDLPGIWVGQRVRIPATGLESYLIGRGLDPNAIYQGRGSPATAIPSPASTPGDRRLPASTGASTR